jgi:putative transposase
MAFNFLRSLFRDAGNAPDDLQQLRAYASQERALGDERFQCMVEATLGRPAACRPRGRSRRASLREDV